MGLVSAESINLIVSPTKLKKDVPMTFTRILPTFDTGSLVGGIIHFEILDFCTSIVITVEISITKTSRGSGKCTLISLPQHYRYREPHVVICFNLVSGGSLDG
jgi:hypothetical protein